MTDSIVQQFAAHLAAITDDAERARVLARVRMLAVNAAPAEAFEPPIRTAGEYLASDIEVPPTLVEPYYIVRGGICCVLGRAGKGKTVMNLNRILRWAAGEPWLPTWKNSEGEVYAKPSGPLRILIIENEGAGGLFHRQLGIMMKSSGLLNDAQRELAMENVLIWGDGGYSGLKLDDTNALNTVRAGVEKHEPDIVFIEPLRGLWSGDENSSTDMAIVLDNLVGLGVDYKCGIMLAHHERKSGAGEDGELMSAGRGSTALEGIVSYMENYMQAKGGDFRELTGSKSRHGDKLPTVRLQWDSEQWYYKHVPESGVETAISEALVANNEEAMTISDLVEVTGESRHKVDKAVKGLLAIERLKTMPSERGGGVRYRLATSDDSSSGGLSL